MCCQICQNCRLFSFWLCFVKGLWGHFASADLCTMQHKISFQSVDSENEYCFFYVFLSAPLSHFLEWNYDKIYNAVGKLAFCENSLNLLILKPKQEIKHVNRLRVYKISENDNVDFQSHNGWLKSSFKFNLKKAVFIYIKIFLNKKIVIRLKSIIN